ncbi:unnamed protein product [Musa textilis]
MRAAPAMAVMMSSSSPSSSLPLASLFLRRISRSPNSYSIPVVWAPRTPCVAVVSSAFSYRGRKPTVTSPPPSLSNHAVELRRGFPIANPAVARLDFQHAAFGYGVSHRRRFCGVRASEVSDPGSIDSPMMQSMEKKIKEQLDADLVIVKDAYGDGRHVSIDVVSKAFEGQSMVNRQRMVYKAIWEELQSTVHAVDQMTTKTPEEANAEK